jgi:DNA-binding NarL/FixJ family response regulator
VQIDIMNVPSHEPPSQFADWRPFLLAPEDVAGRQTRTGEPDRILIVEDDLLIASEMEAALTEAGFEIVGVASTGEEAIELAGSRLPDLAVMDIRLAGDRDGVDTALELFRSLGVRSIFASAYSDQEVRRRAEPANPLGWLQKPYTTASLATMVRRAAKELRDKAR